MKHILKILLALASGWAAPALGQDDPPTPPAARQPADAPPVPAAPTADAAAAAMAAPRKAAILIGVKTYRPDSYNWLPGQPIMLRNLVTPCDGVEAISAKLQLLGWTYDNTDPESEIVQYCDENPAIVEALVQQKVAEFDRPNDLLIIYIAAHGAEIGRRNYVFGPNAKIDLQHEADRLHTYNDNLLFVGKAFDLESAVFRPAGAMFRGNILVVLDACRDDPVSFNQISRELGTPIGGPQIDQRAPGVVVYYATAPGKRVSDGAGLSHMARRLSESLQPGKRVDQVTSAVTRKILEDTATSENIETPIPSGQFNNTDLCFAGCQAVENFARRRVQFAQNAAVPANAATDALLQSRKISPRFNYLRGFTQTPVATPLDVEIFWCKTGVANDAKAKDLATKLLDQPAVKLKARSLIPGAVRFRELTAEENAEPGLQLSDDLIRINFDSDDQYAFAERVQNTSAFPLRIDRSRVNSTDSVAVYLCDGAPRHEQASKLIVQAGRDDLRGIASAVSELAAQSFPGMTATAVDARPQTQEISPDLTQVRFFHEEDKGKAQELATQITKITGQKANTVFLPKYASGATEGDLELWVGKKLDPAVAAKSLADIYAAKE